MFAHAGNVYRTLASQALERMRRFEGCGLLADLVARRMVIPSTVVDSASIGLTDSSVGSQVVAHERIPVITYPYEWSFSMLREGALLTLDLLDEALDKDFILKDGTPFNIALHKGRMVFFDTLSFDDYEEGRVWDGYRQICQQFLFPLMVEAYIGVAFRPLLRSMLEGIPAATMKRLLRPRHYRHAGVFANVLMLAHFEKTFGKDGGSTGKLPADTAVPKSHLKRTIAKLRHSVSSASYRQVPSEWSDYETTCSYSDEDESVKTAFIEDALKGRQDAQLVDLGCNTGRYSMLAATKLRRVIAIDVDAACVDILYRRLRDGNIENVIPLVADLLNPSPALGWQLRERRALTDRIRSDGFLALAIVHHICIAGNVPLEGFVAQLATVGAWGVVEWVDRSNSMVQAMLRNRKDVFIDYTWDDFRTYLEKTFSIHRVVEIHGGTRKLCLVSRQ